MARDWIKYACGCEDWEQFLIPVRMKQNLIARKERELCRVCYKEARRALYAEANKLAAGRNAERGLPTLRGSDPQIAWAEGIRDEKMAIIDEVMSVVKSMRTDIGHSILQEISEVRLCTNASDWIDRKSVVYGARWLHEALLRHPTRKALSLDDSNALWDASVKVIIGIERTWREQEVLREREAWARCHNVQSSTDKS